MDSLLYARCRFLAPDLGRLKPTVGEIGVCECNARTHTGLQPRQRPKLGCPHSFLPAPFSLKPMPEIAAEIADLSDAPYKSNLARR